MTVELTLLILIIVILIHLSKALRIPSNDVFKNALHFCRCEKSEVFIPIRTLVSSVVLITVIFF